MPDEPKTESHSGSSDPGTHPPKAVDDAPVAALTPADEPHAAAEDDDEDAGPANAASPDAILKRVAALGEEDEGERMARLEEEKLEERRSKERKAKKRGKGGLEAAASKRLSKIGNKPPPARVVATAADADPLLDRTVDFSKWAKKNQSMVTGVVAAAVLAVAGSFGYVAYEHKRESSASTQLAKAVADEQGRIGDPDKEEDADRPHDPTPIFKTNDDRREAALQGYRGVETKYPGTGAAILARLAEGSLLLDKEDADGALAAYGDVVGSALAHADTEVRGRALEGLGFAYELKADAQTGDGAKDLLEKAAKEYRELTNTDVDGFKELGMYHQARIFQKEGSKDQAVDLLKKLHERLHKGGSDEHTFVYLEQVADDALRSLAPDALPPKSSGMGPRMGGRGGKNQLDPATLQRLMDQMKQNGGKLPGAPPKAPQ